MGSFLGLRSKGLKGDNSTGRKYTPKVLKPEWDAIKKLERIIFESELIHSGRVHLLGLNEIKRELGDKWPELQERILDSLNKIVSTRIGADDVFFHRSDEEHIIVFANASDDQARLICAKILQELSELYLGSADTGRIIVKTAVGKMKGKLLFKSMSLDQIFDDISFFGVSSGGLGDVGEKKRHFSETETPFEVVFKPVWDVRSETISTYIVNSRSIDRYKNVKFGYDVLKDPSSAEAMIEMDYIVMNETISTMDELFLNNFRAIFSIPLCYETLFNSDMVTEFLSCCHVIPPALYKYISFTLVGFPVGVPEIKLRLIVSGLRHYSRAIMMACDEIPQNISYYKGCGINGIRLALPEKIPSPADYWEQLAKFVTKCRQQHILISLSNVNRRDYLILARESGVHFLSGDVIGPYLDTSGHMSRLSWQDLIAD